MDSIQQAFRNGVEGYAPSTMWFTSGNIDTKEMTYQIEKFREQGIRDYFIHATNDTRGDYLGEYFFRMIGHAAEEAKRLDMNLWIYDEYNWPSGAAGGQVLADEPWTRSSGLFRLQRQVAPGETLRLELPDVANYHTVPLLFVADGVPVELTPEDNVIVWSNETAREALFEAFFSRWLLGKLDVTSNSEVVAPDAQGYLDTLDPEAVQVFLQKTHEKYKTHVGEGFGRWIKGVFTDEVVVIEDRNEARTEQNWFPWSRLFPEKFLRRNGYDIRPRLKGLMDRADAKLSLDYWETVADLFMSAYLDLTYHWCEENGLIYTGHMCAEESVEQSAYRGGDPYEFYKRLTWPGMDTICTYWRINDYNYNMAAKRTASAAHFLGKERVLSETFTMSGWEIRLRDMKRVFNRLALLGVNAIQLMGARYEFMPGVDSLAMTNNWQNPLFKHYKAFSNYVSGIQWLVANTQYDASTLLLYPMTTARATLEPLPMYQPIWGEMNCLIDGLTNALLNLHVPFEICYEQVIDGAEVRDGKFWAAGNAYDTLILPNTRYLKEKTFLQLQEFARQGGRIVAVNGKPETVVGDTAYPAPELAGMIAYECREYEYAGEYITGNENFSWEPMGQFTEALKQALDDRFTSVVRITPSDRILSAVRKAGDAHYIFIVNDNDAPAVAVGELQVEKPFRAMDPETGEEIAMVRRGRSFEIPLVPFGCAVLEVSDGVESAAREPAEPVKTERPLEQVAFRIGGHNTALPQVWQVRGVAAERIADAVRVGNPQRVCDLAEALTPEDMIICRGQGNRWVPVKSARDWFGWCPIDRKPIGPGETVVAVYDFTVDEIPPHLDFVTDPQLHTVWYLNGREVYATGVERVWHYANPVCDIRGLTRVGRNRLVGVCTYPAYGHALTLPCAMLRGDFRVFDDFVLTQKPAKQELRCWNGLGYICHGGDGIYTASFRAEKEENIILELETLDVVEVWLNGSLVCKRLWDPFTADLSGYLVDGINRLELRVTGTYSNFLYKGIPSGISGAHLFAVK